jgi:hypothetical protein
MRFCSLNCPRAELRCVARVLTYYDLMREYDITNETILRMK